jgi:formylglycine-generating enzyme required for sulfatase activity
MCKYETTQAEYLSVMGRNPSKDDGDNNCPVEHVTWGEATNYCARLTLRERGAGRLPAGFIYRLPTEAEWEYACRAGTTTAMAFGNSLSSTQANFNGNYPYGGAAKGPYLGKTTKVGSYEPNAWGLYDMHGNVWEYCLDWYGTNHSGIVTDPLGPKTGSERVVRGGSGGSIGAVCRSATRSDSWPEGASSGVGFRLVLAPVQ